MKEEEEKEYKVGYKKPPRSACWKKGQSGNPKGQPKKYTAEIISELKELGIKPITGHQVKTIYLSLLNQTEDQLKETKIDKSRSIWVRRTAAAILDGKGINIIEKIFDRVIGKMEEHAEPEKRTININLITDPDADV